MAPMNLMRNSREQLTFENLRGLRAEGYIRDSTLDQRDGFGPDIQSRNIRRFADSYGLVLGTRRYTEFVSGRAVVNRREFQQFLEDAHLDLFDVLLVDHTSRFGRNQAECIRYKEELQRLGKFVVFVSQGIFSGSDRDFLSERINETLDEAYSRNLSRYVREGKARKADAGRALGHAPLGYRQEKLPSGRGARMVVDQRSMYALLALLRGYSAGNHSYRTLAQELNARGFRTKRGHPFTEGSIAVVLSNPFYIGKFRYHMGKEDEELREGTHSVPMEVRDLWLRCQDVRSEKGREGIPSPRSRQHGIYPLTGVLVCEECGRPFHGVTLNSSRATKTPRMTHSWHFCSMTPRSIKAQTVEEEFVSGILSHIHLDDGWRDAVLKAITNEGPEPDQTVDVRRIEGAMAHLRKQHLWGVIADEEFKKQYQDLEGQKKALITTKISTVTPNLDRAAALLRSMPALWQHPGVTPEQRRELAREVFQELRLREGRLVGAKPRAQYAPLFAYSVWAQQVLRGVRSS